MTSSTDREDDSSHPGETPARTRPPRIGRVIFACVCFATASLALIALGWHGQHPEFVIVPYSAEIASVEAALVVAIIAVGAWSLRTRRERIPVGVSGALAGLSLLYCSAFGLRGFDHWRASRALADPRYYATARLRQLAANEADYRVRHGTFSANAVDVAAEHGATETLHLRLLDDSGWAADVISAAYACGLDVRLSNPGAIPRCSAPGVSAVPEVDPQPRVVRPAAAIVRLSAAVTLSGAWSQYRGDAARSGRCCAGEPAYSWSVVVGSEFRSTPTVAGDVVVIGAHGSGVLVALDRRTGSQLWQTRAPNWIHNDVVVSNGIVAAGFGNSESAAEFHALGSPPSGVVAYELSTGHRLWTFSTPSSVMTSPVIHKGVAGDILAFASSDGWVFGIDLSTGRPRWSSRVHGRIPMASPALAGDTLYVTGDPANICAFNVNTGDRLWCRNLPGALLLAGHSAPAVSDSLVLMSVVDDTTIASMLVHGRFADALRDVRGSLHAGMPLRLGEQILFALDRSTGATRWRVPLGGGFMIEGHVSGTAVVSGSRAVVVSPIGRTVTRVDLATHSTVWQSRVANAMRGPPIIIGDNVIVIDRVGVLHVFRFSTGEQLCSVETDMPADRVGPLIAGQTAYVATLSGEIRAVPVESLLACRVGVGLRSPVQ